MDTIARHKADFPFPRRQRLSRSTINIPEPHVFQAILGPSQKTTITRNEHNHDCSPYRNDAATIRQIRLGALGVLLAVLGLIIILSKHWTIKIHRTMTGFPAAQGSRQNDLALCCGS